MIYGGDSGVEKMANSRGRNKRLGRRDDLPVNNFTNPEELSRNLRGNPGFPDDG